MICTTCNQNPSSHKNRNICETCSDKYAKIYYKHKVSGMSWPENINIVENIRQADAALEGVAPVPTNPAEAQAAGSSVWLRWDACKPAGHVGLKMLDGECWFCANGFDHEPLERSPRQQAIAAGEKWYTPSKPCPICSTTALRHVDNARCQGCHPLPAKERSPRQQAIIDGEKWYTPTTPCPRCNTKALRHANNGSCKGCAPATNRVQSPRQQAIIDGEKWYKPTTPCPRCDSLALRHVANGKCQGCTPVKETPANTLPADTVLSRADARLLGLAYYRTGLYCPHGHNGFRLVSTGACVDCQTKKYPH